MATITGLKAERLLQLEADTVIGGNVVAGHLILETKDGTLIDAGPLLDVGGDPFVGQYTTAGRPSAVGMTDKIIWDTTLTQFYRSNGTAWVLEPWGGDPFVGQYTTAGRPSAVGLTNQLIWDTDLQAFYKSDGAAWVSAGFGAGLTISDTPYDATAWNGEDTTAPSQNALRDKIETLLTLDTAQSVTAGVKKTLTHDATNAGLRLASGGAFDPSSRNPGDVWYRGDQDRLKYAGLSNVVRELVNTAQAQTLALKTLTAPVLNGPLTGTGIDTDSTMAANSDTVVPSQKAVKDHIASYPSYTPGNGLSVGAPTEGLSEIKIDDLSFTKINDLFARSTANQTVTSSTTLVDATSLVLTMLANATYKIEAFLIYDATTNDGKFAWVRTGAGVWTLDWVLNAPGTSASSIYAAVNKGYMSLADSAQAGGIGAGTKLVATAKGLLITDATAGTLKLQFAQQASDATPITLYAGSHIMARRVA